MTNGEIFEALKMLEQEKGISAEYMIEKIRNAISIAVKRDANGGEDNIVEIDPKTGRFFVAVRKQVVEEVENPSLEIGLAAAAAIKNSANIGDTIEIPLKTKEFGRIAAMSAKHVIRQGIREAEKGQLLAEYQSKENDIVTATVIKTDPKRGNVEVEIGKSQAILPKSEQAPGEVYKDGDKIRVYVSDVINSEKGPKIMISRIAPGLVRRLFEMNVPEVFDGTVEIKAISREAGLRSKVAVYSKLPEVDAVGACIGPKGARVNTIVEELGGEKIDVIKYSEDPCEFVGAALSPANVISVEIDTSLPKACRVTVPDHQLSLAIGNKGHNARLAARLTGWKIDIKPESGFYGEPTAAAETAAAPAKALEEIEIKAEAESPAPVAAE
ncbi:MAG: transcription termination factor NusA [Oscillospiraceae bacterium]